MMKITLRFFVGGGGCILPLYNVNSPVRAPGAEAQVCAYRGAGGIKNNKELRVASDKVQNVGQGQNLDHLLTPPPPI